MLNRVSMSSAFLFICCTACGGGSSTDAGETSELTSGQTAGSTPGSPPDLSDLTDFQALVDVMLPYRPCRGVETLRREVFEQAWLILGDRLRARLWEDVVWYFTIGGEAKDVSQLISFVMRGYDGPLGSSDEAEWRVQAAFEEAVIVIGLLGGRLQEEGALGDAEVSLKFLLECSDPGFWALSQDVLWYERADAWGRPGERLAHNCLMALGGFPEPAVMAKLERRRNELIERGAWRKTLQDAAQQAYVNRQRMLRAGGPRAALTRGLPFCRRP